MSAIASLCIERGYSVFGSDRCESETTRALCMQGAVIEYAQIGTNIINSLPDIAVYSLSIDVTNPEYIKCTELDIPVVSRAEFLGTLMLDYKTRIGISGSHGKSTVTAMIASTLLLAGKKPTVIGGAPICGTGAYLKGGREYFVYEACEYRDSFLHFSPSVEVLLNLDLDHTDYFENMESIKSSFAAAAQLASMYTVVNGDDKNLSSALSNISVPISRFSGDVGDYSYKTESENSGFYTFSLYKDNNYIETFSLSVPGAFNVENAVAAAVTLIKLGIKTDVIKTALSEFRGIPRRMEHIGSFLGKPVFYDYAHHPKEIRAVRCALQDMGYSYIAAIFCPHTYSRTATLFDEFARELAEFSYTVITDIYPAREAPIEGITSAALAGRITELGANSSATSESSALCYLKRMNFDCLVLMGAGNLDFVYSAITENKKGKK